MTTSSQDVERITRQESQGGIPLAAAALMLTSAILASLVSLFALTADEFVVSGPGHEYTPRISGWGWLNLLTAMVVGVVAIALIMNAAWARVAATVVTCLAIAVSFLGMPYYPTGSIVLIALDVVVIWGVATSNTSHESG